MKDFCPFILLILFGVLVQGFNETGEKIGAIGAAGSLYGRSFQITGGWDGFTEFTTHYSYELFAFDNWTREPEILIPMFQERSLFTSSVFQDFLFVFGRFPDVEIISLGAEKSIEHNTSISDQLNYPPGPGPSARIGHTATVYNENIYIFGGIDNETGEYLNDLWTASIIGPQIIWTLLESNSPLPPRAFHSAILYQDSIYIFAGSSTGDSLLDDVWRYDIILGYWVRSFITNTTLITPPPREGHQAVYYGDEAMWVFAGKGEEGFLNDMWRFDLQLGEWSVIFQGQLVPVQRAHFTSVVIDEKWLIFGGIIEYSRNTNEFWSPETGYIPILHPDDFSGEIWEFNFDNNLWTYVGCMPLFEGQEEINETQNTPLQCRSHHQPSCLNDCSGNGVCVSDGQCICNGQWKSEDCSYNVCEFDEHRGYPVTLMDRVLIAETILRIGRELNELKSQLLFINQRIPTWDEFLSCIQGGEQDLSQVMVIAASTQGAQFHSQCMQNSLIPVISEFNQVLQNPLSI